MKKVVDLKEYDIVVKVIDATNKSDEEYIRILGYALPEGGKTRWISLETGSISLIDQPYIYHETAFYYVLPTEDELKKGKAMLVTKRLTW